MVSTLLTLSSTIPLLAWAALELNSIVFIPLIIEMKKPESYRAAMKYLLIQIYASLFLLSSPLIASATVILVLVSIITKLGMSPFHNWYPSVIGLIGWWSALLLSTWQKIAPLYVLSEVVCYQRIFYFFAGLNALVGGFGGLAQTGLRPLLAYSSIGHMGWMLYVLNHSRRVMVVYFFSYFLHLAFLIVPFAVLKVNTPKDLSCRVFIRGEMKVFLMVVLFSLGGLPPLLGFVPKILVLWAGSCLSILPLFLILGRCINLYYYFRVTWSSLLTPLINFSYNFLVFYPPAVLNGVFFIGAMLFLVFYELNIHC